MVAITDGKITFGTNAYGNAKTLSAYVCSPDRKIVCRQKGITQYSVTVKGFNDLSTIQFEVSRFIINESTYEPEENDAYQYLHSFCMIYVPEFEDFGYFLINTEPTITAKGSREESKSFTAESYESILQYENQVTFKINQGTTDSLEMKDPDNVDDIGLPKHNIQLYNADNPDLSLLDLVQKDDYYGWGIGYVDRSLITLERSFDVSSQNIYSFLCSDVSTAFRCIFTFNTEEKLINCYNIETVGENTNIYLSLSHLLSQIDIAPQNDAIYTVFAVEGGNGLEIRRANFGSNKIVNLDYPLSMLDPTLRTKFDAYQTYCDSRRDDYVDVLKRIADLEDKIAAIMDRQPQEMIYTRWSSTQLYSMEDLVKRKAQLENAIAEIELTYTFDGVIDYVALEASPDASMYYSYKDVVIPDIENEIERRESGTPRPPQKTDYEHNFHLYGLNELEGEGFLINYQNAIQDCIDKGYDQPYSDVSTTLEREQWDVGHEQYLNYIEWLEEVERVIAYKTVQVEALKYEKALAEADQDVILQDVDIRGDHSSQTEDEIALIESLYRETDYQNENILITSIDDEVKTVEKEYMLYDDAKKRLEVESVPQLSWAVSSDNLFAMKDFAPLRSQLQVGSFINIYYSGDQYVPEEKNFRDKQTLKFRVIQIDFDGINLDNNFKITFSDMTRTKAYRNDFETMIGNTISSKTNSIVSNAVTAASRNFATTVGASILRPYFQAELAKFGTANIDTANIVNLNATNAAVETLVADYVEAAVANIDEISTAQIHDQNYDPEYPQLSSYWDLQNGVLNMRGYAMSSSPQYAVWSSSSSIEGMPDYNWRDNYIPQTTSQYPYIWYRTKLTMGGNTFQYSEPMCMSGIQGEPGPEGRSVVNMYPYYQLASSQPAKPTTNPPPSPWTTQYTSFSAQSFLLDLYCVNFVEYNDGSFAYSDVFFDSNFQASKQAWASANEAISSANGKNKIFHLPSNVTPSGASEGDIWFQSDTEGKTMRYTNGQWVAQPYGVDALAGTLNMEGITVRNLDAGAISTGVLKGIRIDGNTIDVGGVPDSYDPTTYDGGSTKNRLNVWDDGEIIGYWGEDGIYVGKGEISGSVIRTGSISSVGGGLNMNLDEGSMTMMNSGGTERMSLYDSVMQGYHKSGNNWINDGLLDLSANTLHDSTIQYDVALTAKTGDLTLSSENKAAKLSGKTAAVNSTNGELTINANGGNANLTSNRIVNINGGTKTQLYSGGQVDISGTSINANTSGAVAITGRSTTISGGAGSLALNSSNQIVATADDDVSITARDLVEIGGGRLSIGSTGTAQLNATDSISIGSVNGSIVLTGNSLTFNGQELSSARMLKGGIKITNGTNFNSLITPGSYYVIANSGTHTSGSGADSMINIPTYTTTGSNTVYRAGRLYVSQSVGSGSTYFTQEYISYSYPELVHTRHTDDGGSTWSDWKSSVDNSYPVGSIYMSYNETTNPGAIFHVGSWTRVPTGRFLIGANSSYAQMSTGGSSTINLQHNHGGNTGSHTLTTNEIPSHSHTITSVGTAKYNSLKIGNTGVTKDTSGVQALVADDTLTQGSFTFSGVTGTTGGSSGHTHSISSSLSASQSIIPPYVAVYIWYRSA